MICWFKMVATDSSDQVAKFDVSHKIIEDIVYSLSNRIFSYAEHVPLNRYLTQWNNSGRKNGFSNNVELFNLEARSGASAFLLGSYTAAISSPGVYSMMTPSSCLSLLNPLLSNIIPFYGASKPLVVHVAALAYLEQTYCADNVSVLDFSYANNFTVFASQSNVEAAHLALASTLAAKAAPVIHVYEPDAIVTTTDPSLPLLDSNAVVECFNSYQSEADPVSNASKALKHVNDYFNTSYAPAEYYGSQTASKVIVTFGKSETVAARALLAANPDVGVLSIRIFPFVAENIFNVLPTTCKSLVVLSQVRSTAVGTSSIYYSYLLATLLSTKPSALAISEHRYSLVESVTLSSLFDALHETLQLKAATPKAVHVDKSINVWESDVGDSLVLSLVSAYRTDKSRSVAFRPLFDNLTLAGVRFTVAQVSTANAVLTDVVKDVDADITILTTDRLPLHYRVLAKAAEHSICLLQSSIAPDEATKKLPYEFIADALEKGVKLVLIDPKKFAIDASNLPLLVSFIQLVKPGLGVDEALAVLAKQNNLTDTNLKDAVDSLKQSLSFINLDASALKDREPSVKELPSTAKETSFAPNAVKTLDEDITPQSSNWQTVAKQIIFPEAYKKKDALRPDVSEKVFTVHVRANKRLTPAEYNRNIFHIEFDLGDSGLTYDIGEALGVYGVNNKTHVHDFIEEYGLDANELIHVPSIQHPGHWETRTVFQALCQNIDIFGKPTKKFHEQLLEFETDEKERADLQILISPAGAPDFKRRAEVDMLTYADVLKEFKHAKLTAAQIAQIVPVIKRREYSISSSQKKHNDSVHLLVVVVGWKDGMGRDRYGQCSHYLSNLKVGEPLCVAVKTSVMKLPTSPLKPIVMAGLGTGLAPFRAFLQFKEWQRMQGIESGDILLYLGSRTQREEYLYGEDWEAYHSANLLTHIGQAFSRDQPYKIYIQDVMRSTKDMLKKALMDEGGSFYLCGPTWPLPEITSVLEEVIQSSYDEPVDARKIIEQWKEERRFVIEVY